MTNREKIAYDYVLRSGMPKSRGYLPSDSVKDCRMAADERAMIRCETRVAITGGAGTEAAGLPREYDSPVRSPRKVELDAPRESRRARRNHEARSFEAKRAELRSPLAYLGASL